MNEEILEKTKYCLNCPTKPCSVKGCPLHNDIPAFIKAAKEDNIKEAYKIISKTSVLPGICGRICPHSKQCQGSCVCGIKGEPVSIGEIEAYIFDKAMEQGLSLKEALGVSETDINSASYRVAIIGGGPAGLTCAAYLAAAGAQVTIYEKYNYLGGLLVHGIPEFRLSKEIVEKNIKQILDLGVKVEYNTPLVADISTNAKAITLDQLQKNYDAIFLSFGANRSSKLHIKGEELSGVYGGNELLEFDNHPDYADKIVSVIGGGDVAMDCARTAIRKGAKKVQVIYRRAREQMPADDKEIEQAIEEGVEFLFQNNIVEIKGNGKVEKLELIKTELREVRGETRLAPVDIENSNYEIETDYLITALGSSTDKFVKDLGLELDKWSNIKVDENHQTSNKKIYAGGNLAGDTQTVAWAASAGHLVAEEILKNR